MLDSLNLVGADLPQVIDTRAIVFIGAAWALVFVVIGVFQLLTLLRGNRRQTGGRS